MEAENNVGKQSSATFVNQNRQLKYFFMQNVALQKNAHFVCGGRHFDRTYFEMSIIRSLVCDVKVGDVMMPRVVTLRVTQPY